MRIGQVDDVELHGTLLKPQVETFVKDRVSWLGGAEGAVGYKGNFYDGDEEKSVRTRGAELMEK